MSKFSKPARRRHRRFAVESLEERCLLSAFVGEFPLPTPTAALPSKVDAQAQNELGELSSIDGVEVLDLEIKGAKKPRNSGHKISVAELPDAVVSAVNSLLPRATLTKAETGFDDRAPLFEVEAEFRGIRFDLKLSPDGEMLAIKQPLTATALPILLQNWVERNFSDDSLLEAERVTGDGSVNYVLLFATPDGSKLEAKLRLVDGASPPPPMSDVTNGHDDENPSAPEQVTSGTLSMGAVSLASVSPKRSQTAQHDDRLANNAADQSSRDAADNSAEDQEHSDHTDATRLPVASETSGTTAHVMSVALANATSATRSSFMARVLTDVLPQDLATIERGLREFLDSVNSLTDMTEEDNAVRDWLPMLVTVAAALYGAAHVIREHRKSIQNPVLGAASQSSWTWILNLSTSSVSQEK